MPTKSFSRLGYYPRKLLKKVVAYFTRLLTDPRPNYGKGEVTNLKKLKARVRVGDVLLVSGNARISQVVKVLTQSPWSHVVLYVGDRRDLLSAKEKEEWISAYGELSLKHLVVDADPVRGVHLKPIDESVGLMVRHCRPQALHYEDIQRVIDLALAQLGKRYDLKHIIRLLFFFAFPWELLPTGFRRMVTDFTLSEDDRICSRVLSEAFYRVGYPIRPFNVIRTPPSTHERAKGVASGIRHRGKSAAALLAGGRVNAAFKRITDKRYVEVHLKGTRHIVPADYDLSRFFAIIKDEEDLSIDYRNARTLCPVEKP
ncbi:MAG: hypothetical protein IT291_06205 [Deltaproteobacteria bacterium]|nr:hypothetical protein [Deltaproteobacteria bacterium]